MLKGLTDIFDKAFGVEARAEKEARARERGVQLATALLLIEVAQADYYEDMSEENAVFDLLKSFFHLDDHELYLLMQEARSEADHSASLQEFTRRLHEELSLDEKLKVIEMLWQVALADRHLDKHEDHLVRKIAGLLYVSHSDLIRIRNDVRARSRAD
jgi:uncharacterized tellurite resistance protein B-like protein